MSEKEKIEFLMNLLKTETFSMDLEKAHSLVVSYKWLLDKYQEVSNDNS
jgi:hypothetical protein